MHKAASLTARIFSTFKLFEVQHEGKEICQDLFFFFKSYFKSKESEVEKRLSLAAEFLSSGELTKQARSS